MALQFPGIPGPNQQVPDLTGALQQGFKTAYTPKMLKAELFHKTISPLATLAVSPLFMANPQFQQSLGDLIQRQMSSLGYGMGGGEGGEGRGPTYHEQIGEKGRQAEEYAHHLTQGGKLGVGASEAVSGASAIFKPFGDFLQKAFHVTPQLYNEKSRFDNRLRDMETYLTNTGRYTSQYAHEALKPLPHETPDATLARIRENVPELKPYFEQKNRGSSSSSIESKQTQDFQRAADEASNEIKKRYGVDVDPSVLLNEFYNHKESKFNVHKFLQQRGFLK